MFFLSAAIPSSPLLVKPPTAADRPCDQRLRPIIRPQPNPHNRQPCACARPSPHAAASLALASARQSCPRPRPAHAARRHPRRLRLRPPRQVRITGSPLLRRRHIVPSRRRAEWQARWLPAAASPPSLLCRRPTTACRRRARLQLEQGALAAINTSVAALRSEGVPIHPCEEILRADRASLSSDQIVAAL